MVYATSDLHGYPLTDFLRLLNSAGFCPEDDLYVLGDVIDRHGDGGVETLLWLMRQANVALLLGNHEAMLLACAFLFDEITNDALERISPENLRALSAWMYNGAQPTLKALRALHRENLAALNDLLDYLRDAPLYEALSLPEGDFLLTHAGLGGFSPDKKLSAYAPDELLWHRPALEDIYFSHVTTVFGHTPTQYYGDERAGKMLKTATWIDIDTGAAENGAPMLLRLNDLRPFYAQNH